MADQTFLERLRRKEEPAFRELYEQYYQQVINTSVGFLHSIPDAEDITQEVFLEVFNSVSKFRNESSLSTWIYRITVNKSLNFIRKNKKRTLFDQLESALGSNYNSSSSDTADKGLEEKEKRQMLQNAIDNLPKNQRIAFILSKFDDLQNKRIAEVMNVSLSSVESYLFRAKKNLQKYLVKYYENY